MTLPDRARKMSGNTYREPLSCEKGTLYLTITKDDEGEIREIFISGLGKTGDCISAFADSLARITSLHLRNGGTVENVIDTLEDMRCPEGRDSCSHLIAKILEEEVEK